MKLFNIQLFLVAIFISIVTVSAEKTTVKSVNLKVADAQINDISSFELNKEPLTISLELSTTPAQVFIALKADGNEVLLPTVYKKSKYELSLPIDKIPKFFKKQDLIEFEVVIGDFNEEFNLIEKLFDLQVSEQLKTKTEYKPSLRYGKLPEIHHIFKEQQSFINPIIPIIFIGLIIVLFLGLLNSWAGLGFKFGNIGAVDILFLSTLVIYEFIFIRYYISDSIFTTLARVGILTPLSVFTGSRVLGKLRLRNSTSEKKNL